MYLSHKKEQFQIGYIKALSAHAGLNTGSWAVDNNSIDIMLKGSGFSDSPIMNPGIDIQLKATTIFKEKSVFFTFTLNKKNYDDLRSEKIYHPRYLIILHLSELEDEWIEETETGIHLKNKCYWYSLRGMPDKKTKHQLT